MPIRNAASDVLAAVAVLERAKAACAHLCKPGQMRRQSDLQTRARLIHAVIRSRAQFKALHERSIDLQAALVRFKQRREAMRA
jgi:triphosphoribosyl-dephospho-CoA synthetase